MSGLTTHSTASVIRQLLVDLGYGTDPSAAGAWPVFDYQEPDVPDDCITVFNTQGRDDGRNMVGGQVREHNGFQIRIRAALQTVGYTKARILKIALDETVIRNTVVVESSTYLVHAITTVTDVIHLGKEVPLSKRDIFTINALATLEQQA